MVDGGSIRKSKPILDPCPDPHVSPGVIDGYQGDNLVKAIRTFEERMKLPANGKIDENFWAALSADKAPVLPVALRVG
jgi:peptidoglycan hydrolase-like protein with peptidoglycan-binding domain